MDAVTVPGPCDPVVPLRRAARHGEAGVCAVAVMAKASHPGRTKTRLSPPLSPEQSADLNTVFLRDIADNLAEAARRAAIDRYMAFGPPGAAPFFEHHFDAGVGLLEAWLPDFGDCLWHTLRSLLELGYRSACVLNSDSPTLPTELLIDAARALDAPGDRIVLGPCTDGGYYLLGLKRPHRRLFEDVAWSTDRVYDQTRERARELELDTVILPAWYDVDDSTGLSQLVRDTLGGDRFSAVHRSYEATHTTSLLRTAAAAGLLPACGALTTRSA
jgi:hypothetical protein